MMSLGGAVVSDYHVTSWYIRWNLDSGKKLEWNYGLDFGLDVG